MLYTMKELLDHALANNYAVLAPSIRNEDTMRAAIEAAEEMSAPIILNCGIHGWGNASDDFIRFQVEMARILAKSSTVPVAINLDHGPSFEKCALAISAGMTSVMIDASNHPLDENIAITKKVVDLAHSVGVTVEGEVGHVGIADTSAGVNEDFSATTSWSAYTDVEEFKRFVKETGVDCVAVSIGNKHGAWANNVIPHIEFDLLSKLHEAVPDIPLVLHGGSGTGDENLSRATRMGICKVNVGSELEKGAFEAVYDQYERTKHCGLIFATAREGYKKQVIRHIKLFHSEGKAW